MWRWVAVLVLLGMPLGAFAQKPKTVPDLSPDFMVVSGFDAKLGQLHLKITQYREQDIQELAVGPGVTLKTEKVIGPFQAERFLNLKECKVVTASGEAIPPTAFPERFQAGAAVVVTNDGKAPAKAFLQLLRPETVIVIGPAVKLDPRIQLPPAPPAPPK
jgi:hypothetical protein